MTFTGDFSYDFDLTDAVSAVMGSYSLSNLFSGPNGRKLILLFPTGLIGLSFPWPAPTSVKFVGAVVKSIKHLIK